MRHFKVVIREENGHWFFTWSNVHPDTGEVIYSSPSVRIPYSGEQDARDAAERFMDTPLRAVRSL